ncbi:glycosyltransferase family 2 protein [Microvirga sp. CF3016]|uniref:glycosyltransferase family 2 protein n=1 Tax=Microvirga sp. CF3016 TaxID=3110181 RepID=UPI002E7A04F9|nr:glycosyltransferase family 2 protein [Microvirga sp. CF3016]MEE1610160.1 glycosyltransferase family 2 protein [Microvirga sp. CF3016]
MKTAAIIPCYKVRAQVLTVVSELIGRVDKIFVIDDKCPQGSGQIVQEHFPDSSTVKVVFHDQNQGVGGAVATGYKAALAENFDICIKLDGDGQMDPGYIDVLIAPILHKEADYTKGNRFYEIEYLQTMPPMRIFGNAVLSLVNKCSTGYWNIMDPTNGYTAIHSTALRMINFDKVAKRYFFESDMLFRLSSIRAVVRDTPMPSVYGNETSNLKISRVLVDFPSRYLVNFFKRFFYNYILRDISPATLESMLGSVLTITGTAYGAYNWINAGFSGSPTPTGTVMLVALMVILGAQLLLAALAYDINNVPKDPLQSMPALQITPKPLRGQAFAKAETFSDSSDPYVG